MNNEYIEPTPEGRRNLLLLTAAAIIVGGAFKLWLTPHFFAYIATLPPCDQLPWLRGCLLAAIATPALFGAWGIPHAIRILKAKQSPLPGTWVFRRRPIKRGRALRIYAAGLILVSLAALAFPLFGMHLLKSTPFAVTPKICSDSVFKAGSGRL